MEPEAEANLNRIRKLEIHELTRQDRDFLRARSSYLGRNSRKKFESVLEGVEEQEVEETKEETVDPLAFPPTEEDKAKAAQQGEDGDEE